ncbi:hypothetical protein DE146DRAFT_756880 [Phaeosphaeria sp. MPI-PUGE-AT-0046c]|nr:hypothetical protein DE146DRAFT_756880 [Phaeosphaeria sp. MPI-PUGE-AT-0046c]
MSNPVRQDHEIDGSVQYRVTPAEEITEAQWTICADTFTRHYGVWSSQITSSIGPWTPGARVAMSKSKLKAQSLSDGAVNFLITATASDKVPIEPIGHCFVSQWMHSGARIWWITQLVVRPEHRNQRHATRMLEALAAQHNFRKELDVRDVVGVLSSHPFTICAVLRVFGQGIEHSRLRRDSGSSAVETSGLLLERSQCEALLASAPVEYVRAAKMHADTMSAFTGFYVDHTEPERARKMVSAGLRGSEGYFQVLDEGHEYVCVVNSGAAREP